MKKVYDPIQMGRNIRALRQSKGLTQQELACLAHCSASWLQRLETGKGGISVCTFMNLCRALGCEPSELLHDV